MPAADMERCVLLLRCYCPSIVQEAAQATSSEAFSPDETWQARAVLMDVYHAQTLCWQV
jgi:hypothetical protein